jgi:hypothetical protein
MTAAERLLRRYPGDLQERQDPLAGEAAGSPLPGLNTMNPSGLPSSPETGDEPSSVGALAAEPLSLKCTCNRARVDLSTQ